MINLKTLKDADLEGKKIFLRLDLDVPIENGEITDDSRLLASLDTLNFLFKNWGNVIIGGHLGRPTSKWQMANGKWQIDKENRKFSLQPVTDWFAKHYSTSPIKGRIEQFEGWKIKDNLFILENLRFFEGEEKNDPEFSKKLASLADIYINDAFAASHRSHASIVGIPGILPHFAGLGLVKEIEGLSKVLDNPKKPLMVVIGGEKIETKLPLVKKMLFFADTVLVGGEIAQELKIRMDQNHNELGEIKAKLLTADLNSEEKDITPESAVQFSEELKKGSTIVWNGVVGVVEEGFEYGTKQISQAIEESGAYSVVGGGDTVGYLKKIGAINNFSFVSMGGGAMLEFLAGEKLPGIEALQTA